MNSIWTEDVKLPQFPALMEDKKTDVLIIGGGMAGVLCAYFLQKAGVDYILVEGDRICSGITQNTTAKITSQHGLIYHKLLKSLGTEGAQKYLDINQAALARYAELCGNIDCDFERKSNYVYSVCDKEKLQKEIDALEKIRYQAFLTKTWDLPFQTAGAVEFRNQAQFHPLKFIEKIAKGLHIYENTYITETAPHTARFAKGRIVFDKVIFATHFPVDNKHGMYFMKMYQHRSYVIAVKNGPDVDGMYVDDAMKGMSFRNHESYLLIGGGGHRTGKHGRNWKELRDFTDRYYPDKKEVYHWAAQDCITLDDIPYIGKYSKNMPGCYVATGFNKWGMTSAMVSAMILTDMVRGKDNEYADIFNPYRNMIKPRLFTNLGETALNFLSFSTKRCPHLGCALKWNAQEQSWDCPCHGSRFSEHGTLLDNPATGDGDWKEK